MSSTTAHHQMLEFYKTNNHVVWCQPPAVDQAHIVTSSNTTSLQQIINLGRDVPFKWNTVCRQYKPLSQKLSYWDPPPPHWPEFLHDLI